MENLEKINSWSSLPKDIILLILKYLPLYFRPSIKLINLYWNRATKNNIFYSLGDLDKIRSNYIINNYGHLIRELGIYQVTFNPSILEKCGKFDNLEELVWNLSSIEFVDDLIIFLKYNSRFKALYITDFYSEAISHEYNLLIRNLTYALTSCKNLKSICFNLNATQLMPILECLPNFSSIEELSLELNPSQIQPCLEFIKNIPRLKILDFKICYQYSEKSGIESLSLVFIDNPILLKSLEELSISLDYYDDFDPSMLESYTNQELLLLITNPNLKNINIFRYAFTGDTWKYFTLKLDAPITLPNYNFSNMTKLSLYIVDNHLMYYLSIKCPNLKELSSGSHLVLPYDYENNITKPFKYLTKLRVAGFERGLNDLQDIVKTLLPCVTTLCLYITDTFNNNCTTDISYIPLLFPRLINMVFKSEGFDFNNLLTSPENQMQWEELYVSVPEIDSKLHSLLTNKLTNLKILYINYLEPKYDIEGLNFNGVKFKIFTADHWSSMEFDFNVKREVIVN